MNKFWIILCAFLFSYLVVKTFDYSANMVIKSTSNENLFFNVTFYVCYKLELKKDKCSISSDESKPKQEFSCSFEEPISCYTKGFKDKNPKEIIDMFKQCNLTNLTQIKPFLKERNKNKTSATLIDNTKLILFFDQICVKALYTYNSVRNFPSGFFVTFFNKHHLPYSVKLVIDHNEDLSSDFIPVFKRYCYDNGKKKYVCNWVSSHSTIKIIIYNFTKDDFINGCSNLNKANRMQLVWSCVKNQSTNYDLVYGETNENELVYENSNSNFMDCLKQFKNLSCKQVELKRIFTTMTKSVKNKNDNKEFSVRIERNQINTEFSLQIGKTWKNWITLFCLLFGINLMDLVQLILSCLFKLNKFTFKYKKILISIFILIYINVILAFQIFKICNVNLQAHRNRQIQKPMVENDNLTVYMCFDYKSILNYDEPCFDEHKQTCTLKQKINALWTKKDFLSNIEVTVKTEFVSIDEDDLAEYYIHEKKCFKYNFQKRTIIYFSALMRNNLLKIRLKIPFASHYIMLEDEYPNFSQNSTQPLLYIRKIRHLSKNKNCTRDPLKDFGCTDSDDCKFKCMLNEHANDFGSLPGLIAINPEKLSNKSFIDLPIKYNASIVKLNNLYPHCTVEIEKCISYKLESILDSQANNTLIQINLNPDLTSNTKVNKYSLFAIFIQQMPMVFIYLNFSIRNLTKFIIKFLKSYFHSIQNLSDQMEFLFFFIFIINLRILLNLIIYQDLQIQIYSDVTDRIGLPKLQFCIVLDFEVDLKTGNQLETRTPNSSNLFNELFFLKDDLTFDNLLEAEKLSKLMRTFYFENSKCFELNLADFLVKSEIVKSKIASSALDITINNELSDVKINMFLQAYNFLNFNRAIELKKNFFYTISYTTFKSIRNDRFLFLKNPSLLQKFLLNQNTRNEQHDYFKYLLDTFYGETSLTTTLLPLDSRYFHALIDNRQFLDFIHLRTLSSVLNDWTFEANSASEYYLFNYTYEDLENTKYVDRRNLTAIALHPNLMIDFYTEENKFDVLIVCLNLLALIVFWFNLNLIKLPSFLSHSMRLCIKCFKHLINLTILFASNLKLFYRKTIYFLQCREVF